jgi:hypothetical protein
LWFVRPDTTLKELYERLDEVSVFGVSKKKEKESLNKFINKV